MSDEKTYLKNSIAKLNNILLLDRKDIVTIYMFAILGGVVQLSLPLGIQYIINFVMAGSISSSIVVLIGMVIFGVFINGLLQIRQLQIIEKIKQKLFVRYSLEFGNRLPKLDIEKLDNQYLPELVNRYFEVVSLQKGLDKLLIDLPAAVIQVILGLVLLSFYHPVFIAFGLLLLFIILIIVNVTSPQGFVTALLASKYKYGVAGWLQELARSVKSFKYTRGTSLHIQKTDELVSRYLESRTNHFKILLTQFWSLVSFKIVITAAMLIVGSYLLVNQQINIGQFIAADIVIITIIASIEKIITKLDSVYDALVSVEKLSKITDAEIEHSGSLMLSAKKEGVAIQFNNVRFAFSNGILVLNNINLNITPGQMVQIKGISGSGKSTVLQLLTGAYTNYTGSILINGIPVGNYELQNLRQLTGILLSQEIFHGSILQNITMGNETINVEEVTTLATITGLNRYVELCKAGYDTILLPGGKKLSNNVRKNILLVRALLGEQRLLLLEDPFNHLEHPFKEHVIQYLKQKKSATVLIASHDDQLSSFCDKVYIINQNGETVN